MKKWIIKSLLFSIITLLFTGCIYRQVPPPKPPRVHHTPLPPQRVHVDEYGRPPANYKVIIKNYFTTKLKRPQGAKFTFSKPQKAYKRKGLAYGGDIEWKGWLVDVSVASKSRTGRLLSPKPHMILFKGSSIVEDILGNHHQLIVRVGE